VLRAAHAAVGTARSAAIKCRPGTPLHPLRHSILPLPTLSMWGSACRPAGRLLSALRQLRHAGGAVDRDPRFATVVDADLQFFESVLGSSGVVTDPHELQPYNRCVRRLDVMLQWWSKSDPYSFQGNARRTAAAAAAAAAACRPALHAYSPPLLCCSAGTGWVSMRARREWRSSPRPRSRRQRCCGTATSGG